MAEYIPISGLPLATGKTPDAEIVGNTQGATKRIPLSSLVDGQTLVANPQGGIKLSPDYTVNKAELEEALETKVEVGSVQEDLTAGFAEQLVSPDGVTDEAPYIFRSTAGDTSISDGPARIEKIKGNSVVGNEGGVINVNVIGLKSIGFNQWNEEWENGYFDANGVEVSSDSLIRTKSYIKVLPNKSYFIKSPRTLVHYVEYDKNKNVINRSIAGIEGAEGRIITTLANTEYIRVGFGSSSFPVTTYHNDICINLSWSGYRNGDYEPYEEHVISLPIGQIVDADGNQLFPNGLCSKSNVYDEITAISATKRIDDDGNELDVPVVVNFSEVHQPFGSRLNLTYIANDFGTEEFIIPEGQQSAAVNHETFYMTNLRDKIRNIDGNTEAGALMNPSVDNLLATLGTIMGGTFTKSWDETNKCWQFSFVPNTSAQDPEGGNE